MNTLASSFVAASLLLVLGGCGPASASPLDTPIGLKEKQLIVPPNNPITAEKAELGKVLFFDPRLSGSGKMACVTCHPWEKGWADGEKVSKKDDGKMNTRNTPTVVNVGYLPDLYWDGRAKGLEDNIAKAWKGQMSGDGAAVATKLNAVKGYQDLFQKAFKADANEERIVQALATFLRTLRSGNSPFDRWKFGNENGAVSSDVKSAFTDIFMDRGGCNACHTPPLFTDGVFHNNGWGSDDANPDPGRGAIDKSDESKIGAFKTPTLREAARTAPYFHNGGEASLEEAVKFMGHGGKPNPHLDPQLKDRNLSEADVQKLVALIKSLVSDEPKFVPPTVPQ
jgi:cytochrome c peroxidase